MKRNALQAAPAMLSPAPDSTGQILLLNLPAISIVHTRWENQDDTV